MRSKRARPETFNVPSFLRLGIEIRRRAGCLFLKRVCWIYRMRQEGSSSLWPNVPYTHTHTDLIIITACLFLKAHKLIECLRTLCISLLICPRFYLRQLYIPVCLFSFFSFSFSGCWCLSKLPLGFSASAWVALTDFFHFHFFPSFSFPVFHSMGLETDLSFWHCLRSPTLGKRRWCGADIFVEMNGMGVFLSSRVTGSMYSTTCRNI